MKQEEAYSLYIASIIKKDIAGLLTSLETQELDHWRHLEPKNELIYQQLKNKEFLGIEWESLQEFPVEEGWITLQKRRYSTDINDRSKRLTTQMKGPSITNTTKKISWRWSLSAAAVLLLLGTWIWSTLPFQQNLTPQLTEIHQIKPGFPRAILQLNNGRVLALDGTQQKIRFDNGKVLYDDGTFVVQPTTKGEEIQIKTPAGGTYEVALPDSSTVWLNAASSIRFASSFQNNAIREVLLEGEAYFDIKKSDKPFHVKSGGQIVQVHGTSFNIAAYRDEPRIKTTLVEGKIKLLSNELDGNRDSIWLLPGEQANYGMDQGFSKSRVPLEPYIAWKKGAISFDDKTFEEIMREIERWYEIEVEYRGPIPEIELFGSINRSQNLSAILILLENSGINFQFNHRKLTIFPNKTN
jgi:transmembrane sensor